jgi:hypothetical protein
MTTPEIAQGIARYSDAIRARKAAETRGAVAGAAYGRAADRALEAKLAEAKAARTLLDLLDHDA